MTKNQLSENIAQYRSKAGMTQEELGRAVSVSAQAVSRWERGGTPDAGLLPAIADVLGVSLDMLFGHRLVETPDLENLMRQELLQTPPAGRIHRACQLAWHMMKVISCISCMDNGSYYRAMTANENLDRRKESHPEQVPVNNYFYMDDGLMQSCVAKDFQYVLLMQEPEFGFSSIMKETASYRKFFELLSREYWLDLLVLGYMVPVDQRFTAAYAAEQLGIPEERVQNILEEMHDMHLIDRFEAKIPGGVLCIYHAHDETLIVPMLYFAGELMHNGSEFYYTIPVRKAPIFTAPLGTNSLSPQWKPTPRDETAAIAYDAGFSTP